MKGSAPLVRATARLVAVCAVLAGLFFMHGLPAPGCHGGAGVPAPSMAHSATVPAAAGEPDTAAGVMATPASRSPVAEVGSAGGLGALCVSTPPPPGWAGLLALLLGVSVVGLARAMNSPGRATSPRNQRLRAPPMAGSALLMSLCLSRT